jgi:flagellar basal-body rod protein FlgF
MSDGIYSALSGAIAQQRSLDIVANNVANASTTGFRADRVAFSEVLPPAGETTRADALRYVAVSEVRTDQSAGALRQTGNPLDLAISGEGYFAVRTDHGVRFTRAGSFVQDGDGLIRTQAGHVVMQRRDDPDSTPEGIVVPRGTTSLEVGADGTVRADGATLGRLQIVRFTDETALEKEGLTLFRARDEARPADDATIVQGHVESANVNAVAGLNELITTTRSFEAFQRVIQGFRQIDERTARDLGSR